jgi:hypothetical protein
MRRALLLLVAASTTARAGTPATPEPGTPDYDGPMFKAPAAKDYVVETPEERSTMNIVAIASVAGGGVLIGGLGVYFNLDSKTQSDKVSVGVPTGRPWTATDQAAVDQASSDRTKAIIFYSLGGAAIIGAAVALIVTDPGSTKTVIHPHTAIAPLPGGAIAMHEWSF